MIRILCTGDIHLGRRPTRIPADSSETTVEHIWEQMVDYAVNQDVDAVVLTGDVVDQENKFYESFGPLQRGLQELASNDIDTFAVSGNHDWDVLPELVDTLDTERFHLLGRGGRWESATLERDGEPLVRFVGWSYPERHVRWSPLESFETPINDGVPVFGLLHADLDTPDSPYAPVTTAELSGSAVDGWLLGHIHSPTENDLGGSLGLYPGSPQPLHPGEPGAHGPWMVEVTDGGQVQARQLPHATVRYEEIELQVGDIDAGGQFRSAVTDRVQEALKKHGQESESLRRAVYRIRCTGRTSLRREFEAQRASIISNLKIPFDDRTATIDRIDFDTRPERNLEELARGSDPPAVLAGLLVDLQKGTLDEEARELLMATKQSMDDASQTNAYAPLRRSSEAGGLPDNEDIREILFQQGMILLETLMAQTKEEEQS